MAFPNTPILDSGVGVDQNPLAGNWSGPVFSGDTQLRRVSNEILGQAAAGDSSSYWSATQYTGDVEIYCTLSGTFSDDGNHVNIIARIQNPGSATLLNLYFLRCIVNNAGTDLVTIRKVTNAGSSVQLADVSVELDQNDQVGLAITGTTLTAYKNGTALSPTATDSAIAGAGYLGFEINGNAPEETIINFGGGNPVTSTAADNPPIGFLGRGAGW